MIPWNLVGFGTRKVTDEVIQPFVSAASGTWFRPIHQDGLSAVDKFEQTRWAGYNHNRWLEEKPPSVVFGILRGTEKVLWKCKEFGVDFYYFDHAYFFKAHAHKPNEQIGHRAYRITLNGENLNYITELEQEDYDRIQKYKIKMPEITNNRKGQKILVAPPTDAVCRYYGIHSLKQWKLQLGDKLKNHTDREVVFREKDTDKPLQQDLDDAHVVITLQSAVGIQAQVRGIPVICDKVSMCRPISIDYKDIENEYVRDDELTNKWIDSLLANQFIEEEIRNGTAKRTIDRLQNGNNNS